jgi:transcriptional regulator with XRE-family HTH domain
MPFVIRQFGDEQTVGEKLAALRKAANFTLGEMAAKTKIRRSYLEAIEKNAFQQLPAPLYARNFIKAYARALGGNEDYFGEQFDSQRGTCDFLQATRLPPRRIQFAQIFSVSRLIKVAGAVLLLLPVAAYLVFQVRTITAPPTLMVSAPTDGIAVDQAKIQVVGRVSREAAVQVNGEPVLLGGDGAFQTEIILQRGVNLITIEAKKRHSRSATEYRRVILEQIPTP